MDVGASDFTKRIEASLKQGNVEYVLQAFRDSTNSLNIRNNSWDLIPVVCAYLTSEHEQTKLFECCEQLIDVIADQSNAEEALLQLIEEIEECNQDTKFCVLLKPLQKILSRIPNKRVNSLAWGLNAVQTYLSKCEPPEDANLVGKEKLLLDTDGNAQRILKLYSALVPVYEAFVNRDVEERLEITRKFLIQLLGKPLAFLDMEVFNGIKSKGRIIAEHLTGMVFQITKNPVAVLEVDAKSSEFTKPGTLGVAVWFYLIYSEQVCIDLVPKVYCPVYFFQSCLHLITALLEVNHQICIEKGLALINSLLRLVKFINLSYLLLDSGHHSKFCTALTKVIIYNQDEATRKAALCVYENYLNSFEAHGFYLLVYNLCSSLNHAGLIGYTITRYKDWLAREFDNEQTMSVYFKGPKLFRLLQIFCRLHKNEESDLVELSDQVVAALNLLRYLALRDRNNATGIWDYFRLLEEGYFKHLRKGVDLSRAHYELKIKEMEEAPAAGDRNKATHSVTVAGQRLLEVQKDEQLNVLRSSLTVFDVISSILSRLVECIEAYKP